MASFFFDDYHFPSELYNRETGDFTTPVRTLLDFIPHILQELPKDEKDQKPIHSTAEDSWTKNFLSSTSTSYLSSLLTSERTKAISEFVIRCGSEYMRSTSEKKQEEERFKRFKAEDRERRKRQNKSKWFYNGEQVSSSEDEEEEKMKEKLRQEKQEKQEKQGKKKQENDQQVSATTNNAVMTSAVAASVLSLSLYSTYQASVKFSDISFHNQLELIITQVKSIIQSTQVWIEEHEKMNDKVPNQVKVDLNYLKELVENLVKLDPRANKRMEATGWGVGAVGGLSALGGFVLGSTIALTGGAAIALGGVVAMVSAKAQSSGKSQLGARLLMENQVREKVKMVEKSSKEREKIIQNEFEKSIPDYNIKPKKSNIKTGDKRKIIEEPILDSTSSTSRKKEKVAVPS